MIIMSVDDSKSVHSYIKMCFSNCLDVQIIDMFNGVECINYFKNPEKKIDLVMLDWEMPEMDGIQTLTELSKLNLNIPIIMVTSKNEIKEISTAISLGAKDYIMKPFTPDILIDKINVILGINLDGSGI